MVTLNSPSATLLHWSPSNRDANMLLNSHTLRWVLAAVSMIWYRILKLCSTSKRNLGVVELQPCQLIWELRVIGWDVTYGAEFVPTVEGGYTVIVQKARKIAPTDEPVISNSFKIGEPGKVILTIDNQTSKKKKLLYRSKTQPCD